MLHLAVAAAPAPAQDTTNLPHIGAVERLDPAIDRLVAPDAAIEVLAGGFTWSEGPVWIRDGGYLLFSEIPSNTVMKWEEGKGVTPYLNPSGYTGVADYGGEPGSNGLLVNRDGNLVLCEHGDRRISVLTPDGGKRTLADNYEGRRFNSPNDVAEHSNGDLYFTDPIYGLPQRENDPRRELDFCGVYRWSRGDGSVTLLTREFERPNGIAFSPDEKTLYVAQSHGPEAVIKAFPVRDDGTLGDGKVLFDGTPMLETMRGLPDGLKVDATGHLFATGPGGVLILSPEGKLLGRIATGELISNVAWGGPDGSVLYMTSDTYLCRIPTLTKGARW